MSHLVAILEAYKNYQDRDQALFLATVVKTQGSTYRRPGARMLLTSKGLITGMVSGGCLENDIFHHIQQQLNFPQPFLIIYDTTADEDIIWGFGIGCDGVVQVLIERLDLDRLINPITFLAHCLNNQQTGVLATVFRVDALANIQVGARLSLDADGTVISEIDDTILTQALIKDAQTAMSHQRSTIGHYQFPDGSVEAFIEVIQPPISLVIFGAGQDVIPVAQFAKNLGWFVTIVDCRSQENTHELFFMADQIILTARNKVSQTVPIHKETVTLVMTHNYYDDLEVLKMLLLSPAQYIGVLGSRKRTARLLQELGSEQLSKRLYAPVGLDIGAQTPEEISLAILAEIQAVISGRDGGFLRERHGTIH